MELHEFGPDDAAAVAAFVDVRNAAAALDSPWSNPLTPYRLAMDLRHGWDGEPDRAFLVEEAGTTVGQATLGASEWDNLDLAWLGVVVHPDHRRRGIGRAAVAALHEECHRIGRPLVGTNCWDGTGHQTFVEALGYEQKSRAMNRRQHLDELPDGLLDELCAEAEPFAHDYELLRVAGHSPEPLLQELVAVAESINDAPLDDLEFEDEVYPPERLRAFEHAQIESGHRLYRVLARHRTTGELAGHTVVAVDAERPWLGVQEDTSVVREHRGHRLGLLLKADLGRWLRDVEPELRTLDTWNAESNDHMIGVNERLGYRVLGRALEFQQRLDATTG